MRASRARAATEIAMKSGEDIWCAMWSRDAGESALGTAVAAARFVLVELPLPWPAAIEAHPLLAPVRPILQDHGSVRILALGCESRCSEEHTLVAYARDVDRPFAGFTRTEVRVRRSELADAVVSLVLGEEVEDGLRAEADAVGTQDFLLCTHGRRDRCCGKMGGRVFEELRHHGLPAARLWRTSHTGGHRFAPTGISFPDGMAWAGLDAGVVRSITDRSLSRQAIKRHLRGCCGFADALCQTADAAGFIDEGWDWLETPRSVAVVSDDGRSAEVRIECATGGLGDASDRAFAVQVERGRVLPIALCGQPISSAVKSATELVVRSVARP